MDTAVLFSALAAMAGAVLASYAAARTTRSAQIQRAQLELLQHEAEVMRSLQERERAEGARYRDLLTTLIQKIPDETRIQVTEQLSRSVGIDQGISVSGDVHLYPLDIAAERSKITQEISHSLRTPLAQIEAAALVLHRQAEGEMSVASVARILQGVEICKCFVSAYRNFGRMQQEIGGWGPESIGRMLEGALAFYSHSAPEDATFGSESLPDRLTGYSNDFIVAALLPLLENAAEAAPRGGGVNISFADTDSAFEFVVVNDFDGAELPASIFNRGSSTKKGHEGVGLSVSKGLIEDSAGGSISVSVADGKAVFTASLPKGSSNVHGSRS